MPGTARAGFVRARENHTTVFGWWRWWRLCCVDGGTGCTYIYTNEGYGRERGEDSHTHTRAHEYQSFENENEREREGERERDAQERERPVRFGELSSERAMQFAKWRTH